jgi:hypothetical protein
MYVPTSMGNFSDFPWDPSLRQAVSNAVVVYLSFLDNFAEAFPGTPADDFALIATGNIAVSAGYHQVCTTSLDGSWLFVDGMLKFNNNIYLNYWNYGYYDYPITCQNIQLNEGIHTITVYYFKQHANRTGSRATLDVWMDGSLINLNGKTLYYILYKYKLGIDRGLRLNSMGAEGALS